MPTKDLDYKTLSDRFKLLAHPERLRILDILRHEPECVCHLEALLDKPQPYISQHLRLLREANIIQDEREGVNIYYRLTDQAIAAWLELALGPAQGEHPGLAYHKQRIACPCPKCKPQSEGAAVTGEPVAVGQALIEQARA